MQYEANLESDEVMKLRRDVEMLGKTPNHYPSSDRYLFLNNSELISQHRLLLQMHYCKVQSSVKIQ